MGRGPCLARQRRVLADVVARVAPGLAGNDEVVDALCEAYGFRPRELAQAAERLALAGEVNAADGPGAGGGRRVPAPGDRGGAASTATRRRFARFVGHRWPLAGS